MQKLIRFIAHSFLLIGLASFTGLLADNQTPTISTVLSDGTIPYRIRLELADFQLPIGVQSYVHGRHCDKFLIITGRIDGLHGFVNDTQDNFPPRLQNTNVFVVDLQSKKTFVKSLLDPSSGLTQAQVDLLSVTAAQGYTRGKFLYITGGYGVDSSTGQMNTKNALTAIDIPGLINWVVSPSQGETASQHIRQIFDDIFKITGGYMHQAGDKHPTLLIMGQEFDGFYGDSMQQPPEFQQYSEQVRRFFINDDGVNLSITALDPLPIPPNPNYHRRDLNVAPVVRKTKKGLKSSFVELSGVFTSTDGVWTVPVEITADGQPSMADPSLETTFKQGMNNYDTATFGMYDSKRGNMYVILLGGMSYGFFQFVNGGYLFATDPEIPFINDTTTIRITKKGDFTQHFMASGGFPFITSTTVNPGNELLFGSEAEVFILDSIKRYKNDVIKFEKIKRPTLIGYVVGGIKSTLPNTNTQADSSTSELIFKIIVEPRHIHQSSH